MVFFTIACGNYLGKALTLGDSLREHHPESETILIILERNFVELRKNSSFSRTVLASDFWGEGFDSFIFRHEQLEAATAIKARAFSWLLKSYPQCDRFVYLDPDILVLSPLKEVADDNLDWSVLITPHLLQDETSFDGLRDNVFRVLKCGIYNLGFLGIRRSANASRFLSWWESRLEVACYVDFDRGLFVDQKWMDLGVSLFETMRLEHPGYNMANWNVSKRPLEEVDGRLITLGQPLRFFHFSGIDKGKDLRIMRKYLTEDSPVFQLRSRYKGLTSDAGDSEYRNLAWSYANYSSGERIANEARIRMRWHKTLRARFPDPYSASNDDILGFHWRP